MKTKLTKDNAKQFALKQFEKLSPIYKQWNIIHSECIIDSIHFLSDEIPDKNKFVSLAWVHDIGKVISEKDHAKHSLQILRETFELDAVEIDCILNHGSSNKPETKEGNIFRYLDGLSLFHPRSVNFQFFVGSSEGKTFQEIKDELIELFKKYKERYSNSEKAVSILNELMKPIN